MNTEHLNEEEMENLKRGLFEYNDIQYKEGENLTFTSTIRQEIKSFLELWGFYRKFIPNIAYIVKPMTIKLKKGSTFNINDKPYIEAFEKTKILVT